MIDIKTVRRKKLEDQIFDKLTARQVDAVAIFPEVEAEGEVKYMDGRLVLCLSGLFASIMRSKMAQYSISSYGIGDTVMGVPVLKGVPNTALHKITPLLKEEMRIEIW